MRHSRKDSRAAVPLAGLRRLEGLCGLIRSGPATQGVERLEARFRGPAFSPHRHDTYAIGVTLAGVQTFDFRGERWHCLPGQCHILHPDEMHDGRSGTNSGFAYRILYIDPALIQQALGGRSLPFVANPVVEPARLPKGFAAEAWDMDALLDDVARCDVAIAVADLLMALATNGSRTPGRLAMDGLFRVRDRIAACPKKWPSMTVLERLSGVDRWTLARQFRAAFGTSPTRFRTMRQLDRVRHSLRRGVTLAEAAMDAGFADQSHMTRQFKRAYGLTPGQWVAATA